MPAPRPPCTRRWRGRGLAARARHRHPADGQPPVGSRATASSPGPVLPPMAARIVADAWRAAPRPAWSNRRGGGFRFRGVHGRALPGLKAATGA